MSDSKPIVLLDTDVVSNLMKSTSLGLEYLRLTQGHQFAIAFITAGELRFGARRRRLGVQQNRYLDTFLAECAVLRFETGMEHMYARLMFQRQLAGRRLEKADGWLATPAAYYGVPLVTHDSDFVDTPGLRIITASKEARAAQLRVPAGSGRPLNLSNSCRCSM